MLILSRLHYKMKDESIWIIETKGGESDSGSDENIDKYAKKSLMH